MVIDLDCSGLDISSFQLNIFLFFILVPIQYFSLLFYTNEKTKTRRHIVDLNQACNFNAVLIGKVQIVEVFGLFQT